MKVVINKRCKMFIFVTVNFPVLPFVHYNYWVNPKDIMNFGLFGKLIWDKGDFHIYL